MRRIALVLALFSSQARCRIITHQGYELAEGEALAQWTALRSNDSDSLASRDLGFTPWTAGGHTLFARQRPENPDGALLCPDGKCVDGRLLTPC
jgi:hypothetical protein